LATQPSDSSKAMTLIGCSAIFLSAFCFYFCTVVIRWSQPNVTIDPAFFTFSRFLLGFLIVLLTIMVKRYPIRIYKLHFLLGRAVTNCLAVYFFYRAVKHTSVAEANILNMTYPLFIAIFTWLFFKSQRDLLTFIAVLAACTGVWLVLTPEGGMTLRLENIWGLLSGLFAAAAMIYLNLSRLEHSTTTVLFFVFGAGSLIILLFFRDSLFLPDWHAFVYLAACSVLGVGGQYLLTLGFRYVTAVEGSIISSTRILLAAVCGPLIAMDPALNLYGWIGALLIFGANVMLAFKKAA